MGATVEAVRPLERAPTGVAGLDGVLLGGLFQGDLYLIQGGPGTGKTVLGNELCFRHAARGGRALYVTLLAETHARMIDHLQDFDFFDPSVIADGLYYVSGYQSLAQEGLDGLLTLLRQTVRDQRATLLVVDGTESIAETAESALALRRFALDLHALTEVTRCTAALLTASPEECRPVSTVADGIIVLADDLVDARAERHLLVQKLRGSSFLPGWHFYTIEQRGIKVFPRIEALLGTSPPIPGAEHRHLGFGIPRLDEMMDGGVIAGSSTMVLGTPGSGKTLLGLSFLNAGAAAGQPGVYFGFYETPPRLIARAESVGLPFASLVDRGSIDLIWQLPLNHNLDDLAERLLDAVRAHHARRLVIDGLHGFEVTSVYPQRLPRYLMVLANELRACDVTTLITVETADFFSPTVRVPMHGVAGVVDNIVFLRSVELRSQLHRLISILKMREGGYDTSIREFTITDHGIEVARTFASAEAILTGIARPVPSRPARRGTAP